MKNKKKQASLEKILASHEILQEIIRPVDDKTAKKHAFNIKLQAIEHLRSEGKIVRAVLLKNNLIAFIIQSPLYAYFEKGKVGQDEFAAALKYSRDYFISVQDNMAKQSYDGTGISERGFRSPNKEPSQNQIEAHRRIEEIKRELNRCSQYPLPKNKIHNKRYVSIIEAFLERELNITEVMKIVRLSHAHLMQRIVEALEIIARVYKLKQA